MKLQALLCIFLVSQGSAYRKITSSLNPGCDECGETVVVVKAVGDYDILYQVWDFSRGIPTIIAFIAGLNSNLSIKWNGSVPTRFDLSELPKYTMAVALDSIIEYDDTEDKAVFDPKYRHRYISLNDYYWARTAALIGVDDDAMVIMHYIRDVTPRKRTTIEVRLESSTTSIASVLLPHLLFTNNATVIDITLSDMPTHESYKHSRFAFHFVLLCNGNSTDTMHYFEERTLDDEHAPGVFKMIYFRTPESFSSNFSNGGYIQFRPVAYREYKRSFASSTGIKVSPFNSARVPPRSTMDVFFSNVTFPPNKTLVQDVIISFGDAGDGFYNKYNVTAWEFAMGMGSPLPERMSLLVMVLLCLGLGVPALLAVVGIGVVVGRRRHWQRLVNHQ